VLFQKGGVAMASSSKMVDVYNRTKITTANHATVISLLHHRCVQHIQLSLQGPSPKRKHLNAAQNILAQFERSLDKKKDLSKNFFLLYDYCYCLLESDRPDSHRNALAILIKIRDAFDIVLHRNER
jgi:flagellin-specific chaperone FliS